MTFVDTREFELARIENLRSYEILDTPKEILFDELTELAALVCNVPIAAISLMDSNRQWIKSSKGISVQEFPRELSLCENVIRQREIFVIADTHVDARFANHPMVLDGPKFRFYAGAPLVSPDGYILGSICIGAHEPKQLSSAQIKALESLAHQVVSQIVARKSNDELLTMNRSLEQQQAQMMNSAKLVTLGEMAGGIAHEINNPLNIIQLHMERIERLLLKNFGNNSEGLKPVFETIANVTATTERIVKIIRGLKSLSRQGAADPMELVNIRQLTQEMMEIVSYKASGSGVKLANEVPDNVFSYCRAVEVSQIVLNLIGNGIDAVSDLPEKWVRVRANLTAQGFVQIIVSDSGNGIPESVVSKMMNPFFTTKGVGKGTGLGLSISKGLAERNGGQLSYLNDDAHTSFSLTLPCDSKLN